MLYETFSVEPIAALAPRLLDAASDGARLLLADPPGRTPKNRATFLSAVQHLGFDLEEVTRAVAAVDAMALADDEDLMGGLESKLNPTEIEFCAIRRSLLGSTVGVKRK